MKNCILVLIFSIFLVSCKNSIYDDKNSTVMDVLIEIEKGTSISLSLHETLVHIIKGVGGGDVSSDTHDVSFEIIRYVNKSDMEYGIQFSKDQCHGDTYIKGWYLFCMHLRYEDTKQVLEFVNPELVYDNPRWS